MLQGNLTLNKTRIFFLILFMLSVNSSFSQNKLKSFILPESSYPPPFSGLTYNYYNLSAEDIKEADNVVIENKKIIATHPNYYAGNKKGIFPRYKKYYRQYYGYLNAENERMVLINYLFNYKHKRISEDYIDIHDGGNNYWHVLINLDRMSLIDYYVNGM